ncbi:manganese efflux pump MntP [Romboutsia sp.]|uniref:manganese efflux pump MntP n=1 Tax=Romboutsia sp. TaxID=1965302 RepID=UPI003F3EA6C4
MSFIAIFLTALALSMDAFAVSITKGMTIRNLTTKLGIKIALAFGIFQGGMPLLGWLLGISFESYIKSVDHWIALILLGFLGYRMINGFIKSKKEDEELEYGITQEEENLTNKELLVLSIATSIDALAVGISFACLDVNIVTAALAIGGVTFVVCLFGVFLGKRMGKVFSSYAELMGGIILILIGLNIFNEHSQLLSNIINSIF